MPAIAALSSPVFGAPLLSDATVQERLWRTERMDEPRFDSLTKRLAVKQPRRRILGAIIAGIAGGPLSTWAPQADADVTCAAGLTPCQFRTFVNCVDLSSDPDNCGGCNVYCETQLPGSVCVNGVCISPCPPGLTNCRGRCVDLSTDTLNCGRCGVLCQVGGVTDPDSPNFAACVNGTCRIGCAPGSTNCQDRCWDLSSNAAHCGACDNACEANQECVGGYCAAPSSTDQSAASSASGESDEEAAAAAATAISKLEAARDYEAVYARLHPDARAIIPAAAVVGWYRATYADQTTAALAVTGVRFVDWTWPVTGQTYPDAAEISYVQPYWSADGTEHDVTGVEHLARVGSAWNWFFGLSREFVEEQIATYAPGSTSRGVGRTLTIYKSDCPAGYAGDDYRADCTIPGLAAQFRIGLPRSDAVTNFVATDGAGTVSFDITGLSATGRISINADLPGGHAIDHVVLICVNEAGEPLDVFFGAGGPVDPVWAYVEVDVGSAGNVACGWFDVPASGD